MRRAIRSEVLRAVSGLSILPVYFIALLMPLFVLFSDGSRFDVAGVEAGAATTRLLEPLAWSAIAAAFVGAYGVTREYYYGSMDRALTGVGFRRAFTGKLVAGAFVASALSVCIFVLWTVGVHFLLAQNGLSLVLTQDAWQIYAGALLGSVLGAFVGGAVGWITRNYYVTAALVLAIPMAVEFALLRNAPELARFSPGLALAALSVPGYQDQLLEFIPALAVAFAWGVGLVALAWYRRRRAAS